MRQAFTMMNGRNTEASSNIPTFCIQWDKNGYIFYPQSAIVKMESDERTVKKTEFNPFQGLSPNFT